MGRVQALCQRQGEPSVIWTVAFLHGLLPLLPRITDKPEVGTWSRDVWQTCSNRATRPAGSRPVHCSPQQHNNGPFTGLSNRLIPLVAIRDGSGEVCEFLSRAKARKGGGDVRSNESGSNSDGRTRLRPGSGGA